MELKLFDESDFLAECKTELLSHLSPTLATIVTAKNKFKEDNCYNVHAYWSSIAFELPCLHLIFRVLSVCASSEAACERMFSLEKVVHSSIRNTLSPALVKAIMCIRLNFE